jgi:DNA-binding transcriptional regulator GbsR (MarR family)
MSDSAADSHSGSAPDRDDAAVARFVERFASILETSGMPRMPARVFVALLAADSGVLTAAQLAEGLGASPAAISGAVRYLAQVGLITRAREPGSRRDRYRVDDDAWYEALLRREHLLARFEDGASEGVGVLGADTPAGQRMATSRDLFAFLRREMPRLLERWHEERDALTRSAQLDAGEPPQNLTAAPSAPRRARGSRGH